MLASTENDVDVTDTSVTTDRLQKTVNPKCIK